MGMEPDEEQTQGTHQYQPQGYEQEQVGLDLMKEPLKPDMCLDRGLINGVRGVKKKHAVCLCEAEMILIHWLCVTVCDSV